MTEGAVQLDEAGLDGLIQALRRKGRRVIGPKWADDAIVNDEISGVADLPAGWGDELEGGRYRLVRRDDGALFGYTLTAQGWKRVLHPPAVTLFSAAKTADGYALTPAAAEPAPMAFLGVRACEIAAIAAQVQVFETDPGHQARRNAALIIAVECGRAGATCFCASMGTGPAVTGGYDIKLVELEGRRFIAQAGSAAGAEILAELNAPAAAAVSQNPAMGRLMAAETARSLSEFAEHPRWDEVAKRCLACGNCTMVCPTCFCTTVEDQTSLTGDTASRVRRWDSCFSVEFSYIHGGAVRTQGRSRYRQWITHKLSSWHTQFGRSGCTGCGRCIVWCPVGIDITEEVRAIDATREGR